MADYGRSGDHETRDREGRSYGRDMGDERGGGWGRGGSGRDREPSRGGGMFGSNRGGDDWSSGRREELGWGSADRDSSARGREEHRPADGDRSRAGRDERGWSGEGGRSSREERGRDRQFGYDDRHEGLPIDETSRLIASNKVEGTAVYSRDGARLGSIYNFMVDKRSGKVEYAVMTYGGFLGMGTRYYPMPWEILEYDTRLGGYRVDMMERDLERAPSFDRDSEPEFDRRYNDRVRGWYGLGGY